MIVPSADVSEMPQRKPIRAEARARLIDAIAKARSWVDELVSDADVTTDRIADREGCSERSVRLPLSLAFLAPDIVQAAINGTLPRGTGLSRLAELSADWQEQRRHIGCY